MSGGTGLHLLSASWDRDRRSTTRGGKNPVERVEVMNKKRKFPIRHLLFVLLIIVAAGVFLGVRNLMLKRRLRDLQKPSYIFDTDELARMAQRSQGDVVVVKNGEVGLWDREGKIKVQLVPELIIGEESDPHKAFYSIGSIIADDDGNIYVCETFDCRIKKFDRNGNYLLTFGRKGRGPGEFLLPSWMDFDNKGNLWVLDCGNQRASCFSADGKYLKSVRLPIDLSVGGFAIDRENNFYISMYDFETDKVIHKYSPDGVKLISFGEPVAFKSPLSYTDMTIKKEVSRGSLTIVNDEIYYTQKNPYEIRKYTTDGRLKMRIFRKNSFMPPAKVEVIGKDKVAFRIPARSKWIGVLGDKIINRVWIPEYLSTKISNVIDIFNLSGQLLATLMSPDETGLCYVDKNGRIYGSITNKEGIKKIVRFSLVINKGEEVRK